MPYHLFTTYKANTASRLDLRVHWMTASQWFAAHQRQARLGTIEVAAAREQQPMSVCLGFLADKKLDEHTEEVNGAPLGDAARPPCSVLLQNSRPPRRCCSACHLQRAAPRPCDRRRRVHSSTRRSSGCQGVTRLAATKSPTHRLIFEGGSCCYE